MVYQEVGVEKLEQEEEKSLTPNMKKHTEEIIKRINKMENSPEFCKLFMSLINAKKESLCHSKDLFCQDKNESAAQQHVQDKLRIYGCG